MIRKWTEERGTSRVKAFELAHPEGYTARPETVFVMPANWKGTPSVQERMKRANT